MSLSTEAREVLLAIADNIERRGHYQGGHRRSATTCCVVMNPAWRADNDVQIYNELMAALESAVGLPPIVWNDLTPTPDVLATLRRLAEAG